MASTRTAPHPGSACCDPEQDLAGWLAAERARIAILWRWSRVLRQRGNRLRRDALAAGDRTTQAKLDVVAVSCCGTANAIAQDALIRAGHADRVEQAHQHRLGAAA